MEHLAIVLVLDGSGSVGNTDFNKVKKWVKDLAAKFDISSTSLGVVQYSHYTPRYVSVNDWMLTNSVTAV